MSSQPHLPVSRIKTIMQSSSDAEMMSKESTKMMTRATELFIRTLAEEGYKFTNKGKKLQYKHLAEVVNVDGRYEFVRDIMPKKITVLEYKKILTKLKKSGELSDDEIQSNHEADDDDDDDVDEEESGSNSSAESTRSE